MTPRKKTSGFDFRPCLISAWPWCICPPTFAQVALSNLELLTFSEIQAWIFSLCEFGHSGVLTGQYLCSVQIWFKYLRRGASSHITWCKISLKSPKLLTFFEIQDGGHRHLGFSVYVNFGHSGVLVVWYLCSVPNSVQKYVIVTEIDAHLLQTFIWWRHAN